MRDWDGIWMILSRELLRYSRERNQILVALFRPFLWLFVMGMGLAPSFKGHGGVSYLQYIFPGILGMTVLFSSISSAISIIWDREFGFLKEILVAPISRSSIVMGKSLGGSILATIQGAIVVAFAPLVGVPLKLIPVALTLLCLFLIAFPLTGMGIAVASRVTSFEGFGAIINFLVMPIFFLSGALYPLVGLPGWLAVLVKLNPLTYGIDLLKWVVLGQSLFPVMLDVGLTVSFALVMAGLATWSFSRMA